MNEKLKKQKYGIRIDYLQDLFHLATIQYWDEIDR